MPPHHTDECAEDGHECQDEDVKLLEEIDVKDEKDESVLPRKTNDFALGIVGFAIAAGVSILMCMIGTQTGWWQIEEAENVTIYFGLLGSCSEEWTLNETVRSCIDYSNQIYYGFPVLDKSTNGTFAVSNFLTALGPLCMAIYALSEFLLVVGISMGTLAYFRQEPATLLFRAGVVLLSTFLLLVTVAIITLSWFLSAADNVGVHPVLGNKQGLAFAAVFLAGCGALFGLVQKKSNERKTLLHESEEGSSALKEKILCILNCGAEEDEDDDHSIDKWDIIRIIFVAIAVILSVIGVWQYFLPLDVISIVAVIIGGYPIYKEAIEDGILELKMTMELSMTLALVSAMAIQEFQTAVIIVLFVLIAEVLEHLTVAQGRKALKKITDILPHNATVKDPISQATKEVPLEQLQVGDILYIKPGSCIPVDGEVIDGNSFVDQATITGESMSVEKVIGSTVYAGTLNQNGILTVKTVCLGSDTAFGKIIEAVEKAEKSKAPIHKTADRLAAYLVYFALLSAALTFIITFNIRETISVIIVAGACGVAAGTPLAILGAIGQAARKGCVVKGGVHLELLAGIDTICLDKTGTLTLGDPRVTDTVVFCKGYTKEEIIQLAAIAEKPSEHPVGKAILKACSHIPKQSPTNWTYTPGAGIVCKIDGKEVVVGNTTLLEQKNIDISEIPDSQNNQILVASSGKLLGGIKVADILRTDAKDAVQALKAMNLRTLLITGDAKIVSDNVARQLGVDEVLSEQLPNHKLRKIKALISANRKVAMIGDGVNDAPALTAATVGIAMGSGTDVARECASVVLLGDDLMKVVDLFSIARQCRGIIYFNFIGTIIVDVAGIILAAMGYITPLIATAIHVISELFFICNSARLLLGGRTWCK